MQHDMVAGFFTAWPVSRWLIRAGIKQAHVDRGAPLWPERGFPTRPPKFWADLSGGRRLTSSVSTPRLFAVGRTADGDRHTGASLRVIGSGFAAGQAGGVAATQHAKYVQAAVAEVQSALRTHGAIVR
jgi:hypothetical protein